MDFAKSKFDQIKTSVGEAVNDVDQLRRNLADQAEKFKDEKLAMIKQFEEEKRNMLKGLIQNKLERIFDHGMNVAGMHLKESIKDDYMPMFVQRWVDNIVDTLWPDVKIEVKNVILTGISPPTLINHGEAPSNLFYRFVAKVRYTLMPYDRSIWRQLRDPFWWLWTLITLFPRYGVPQIAFTLRFLFLDHKDEFQLQQFIIGFKALQFINLGIISTIVGSIQYYVCITQAPSNCKTASPQEELFTVGLFVEQVLLVWLSFVMLNWAVKKGGMHFQLQQGALQEMQKEINNPGARLATLERIAAGEEKSPDMLLASEEEVNRVSRGRLTGFLIYDLIIFIICVALTLWVAFKNLLDTGATVTENSGTYTNDNWKFTMSLYWIKALYGMLSFPFVLLSTPLWSNVIVHARPTAYNPWGVTVPKRGKEEENAPWKIPLTVA